MSASTSTSVPISASDSDSASESNDTIVKPIKLMIATPCYGGQCYVEYFESLMSTVHYLRETYHIICVPVFIKNDSLVTRARNSLVAKFMAQKDFTHLMFIDADIKWDPRDVYRLLQDDQDVVGGIYPYKRYDWEKLGPKYYQAIQESRDKYSHNQGIDQVDYMRQNLMRYNLNYSPDESGIDQNLLKIKDLATGFMMIKRHVFEVLFEYFPDLKYVDDCGYLTEEESKYAYALFDGGVVDGRYQSEDWLFCHRWRALGGEIHANIAINLTHIGKHTFEGRFLSSLMIG